MLKLTVSGAEDVFDEDKGEFLPPTQDVVLELEYSLVALSKWEQKYQKAFLAQGEKTTPEVIYFIWCMIVSPENPPEEILDKLSEKNHEEVANYIDNKMTATWFSEEGGPAPHTSEIITNELIYYWMYSYGIPKDHETWHLNRLLTLIKVFGLKNAKPKPMSRSEQYERQRALNAQRRAETGSAG